MPVRNLPFVAVSGRGKKLQEGLTGWATRNYERRAIKGEEVFRPKKFL